MGIIMGTVIGVGTLAVGGIVTWLKKKEDLRQEKLERIIREVDNNKVEEPAAATLEEMTADVDQAICDLGIEDESEENSEMENISETETVEMTFKEGEIAKIVENFWAEVTDPNSLFNKCTDIRAEIAKLDGISPDSKAFEEDARKFGAEYALLSDEEREKLLKKLEKELEKTKEKWKNWREEVQKAVEQKNWYKMEALFDKRYNPYPIQASSSSLYGAAHSDGLITDELYSEAATHYGKLWNYVGD